MPPAATCKTSEQKLAEDQSATGPGSVTHTCVPSARGKRGQYWGRRISLCYMALLRPAWMGYMSPLSTPQKKKTTQKRVIKMAQGVKGTCL